MVSIEKQFMSCKVTIRQKLLWISLNHAVSGWKLAKVLESGTHHTTLTNYIFERDLGVQDRR